MRKILISKQPHCASVAVCPVDPFDYFPEIPRGESREYEIVIAAELAELRAEVARLKRLNENALRNAIQQAHKSDWLWAVAKDVFAVGSTSGTEICRNYGVDPNLTVGQYRRTLRTLPPPTEETK